MPASSRRQTTKRLPLSSQLSFHNQPSSSSSQPKLTSASSSSTGSKRPSSSTSSPTKKRVVRSVKSNPHLRPSHLTPPPPPLPNSPTYPITNESAPDGTPVVEKLLAPPKVVFAPEIFVHRHAREFPHLHDASSAQPVPRRTSPAASIESQSALTLPVGQSIPLSPPMSPLEPQAQQHKNQLAYMPVPQIQAPTKRREPRPLSLVAAQPGGGLFGLGVPLPSELGTIRQEELISEDSAGRETRVEEKDADQSRESSEMSSECNLSFTWEQSIPRIRALPPAQIHSEVIPTVKESAPQPGQLDHQYQQYHVTFKDLPDQESPPHALHDRTIYRKSSFAPSQAISPEMSTIPSSLTVSLPPTPVTPALSFFSSSTSSTSQFASPDVAPLPSFNTNAHYTRSSTLR